MTRSRLARVACALSVVAAAGCATPPPPAPLPRTTVVLMPDEDGRVGAVSVSTDAGMQTIDRAFNASTVVGAHGRPSAMADVGEGATMTGYDTLIAAQPLRPVHFTLNFVNNKSVLTEESRAQIPAVMNAIRTRKPTEISIFGHTDSTGTEQYNMQLSAERAKAVATLLRKQDPTLDHIEIKFFGDKEPLVHVDGKTAEPRNRRAEVMVL
jgi:outer membrane protein OmpA-like peptidoglycan-associated protein